MHHDSSSRMKMGPYSILGMSEETPAELSTPSENLHEDESTVVTENAEMSDAHSPRTDDQLATDINASTETMEVDTSNTIDVENKNETKDLETIESTKDIPQIKHENLPADVHAAEDGSVPETTSENVTNVIDVTIDEPNESDNDQNTTMEVEKDTITESASTSDRPDSVVKCDEELQQVQAMSQEIKSKQTTPKEPDCSVYHLKWFDWKGEQTPIVTQNENGPCPLLAIANVLILARKIILPKMQQLVSAKQLMEYIGDCILSEEPEQGENKELILNYQQNMHDAIDIMYKLQTGIDVNVKFSGVTDFEFTPECIVFDLLKIILYHGWLVDPQDEGTLNVINGLSYNQLVEKMLLSQESEGEKVVDGYVIEEFLNRTASQLTYHGLCELNSTIEDEELCVFFRNNHFSTLYKHKGELFILVTDQGFLTEPAVTWETLINIEGDGQFVNSEFKSVTLQNTGFTASSNSNTATPKSKNVPDSRDRNLSQEDRDYLIALQLQHDEDEVPTQSTTNEQTDVEPISAVQTIDSDHALALKLQQDEDRMARELELQQQQPQQQHQQQRTQQQGRAPQQQPQQSRNPSRPDDQNRQSRETSRKDTCCVM